MADKAKKTTDKQEDVLSEEDMETLKTLNRTIAEKEDAGERDWFMNLTAPEFAFMRADGKTFDDRLTFVMKVKPKAVGDAPRTTTNIKVIRTPHNQNRVIVSCVVEKDGTPYHNLRLFVRLDGKWRLLGWANEAC